MDLKGFKFNRAAMLPNLGFWGGLVGGMPVAVLLQVKVHNDSVFATVALACAASMALRTRKVELSQRMFHAGLIQAANGVAFGHTMCWILGKWHDRNNPTPASDPKSPAKSAGK
eukprot:RCo005776